MANYIIYCFRAEIKTELNECVVGFDNLSRICIEIRLNGTVHNVIIPIYCYVEITCNQKDWTNNKQTQNDGEALLQERMVI